MTAQDYIDQARLWKGTPFLWQAAVRGLGCDCKGLIVGVARELGLPEAEQPSWLKADYGSRVDSHFLVNSLSSTCDRVDEPFPGSLLVLHLNSRPQHLGISTGKTLIHSYVGKVVSEHRLDAAIRLWPIHSIWQMRSLIGGS